MRADKYRRCMWTCNGNVRIFKKLKRKEVYLFLSFTSLTIFDFFPCPGSIHLCTPKQKVSENLLFLLL